MTLDPRVSGMRFYPHKNLTIVPRFDKLVGGYPAAMSLSVSHAEERMSERREIFALRVGVEIGLEPCP